LFPGDSEIDQLYLIQKVLGKLTSEQYEMFSKNPRFLGLKFPNVSKPETLEKKYVGKMSKKALSLMNGLLRMDPKERLTGIKALTHSYFDDIRFKDEEFFKIAQGDLNDISNRDVTRPIQSSQGYVAKVIVPVFDEKHRQLNSRAGITAYSGFEGSMKEFSIKAKNKKSSKSKKMDALYGKKSLYDIKNVSVAQFTEKGSFGKHKYSNGTIRNRDILNIYGNGEMANTQYTSRNDEANISNTFLKSKKTNQFYKGASDSRKLIETHDSHYEVSTPNAYIKVPHFKADLVGSNGNNVDSRESLHNNIIVEDEKEINYSTSNHSSKRKSDMSRDRIEFHERMHTENGQNFNERDKDKSFSKDLIMQMKEKIRKKQRNGGEMSKILVLGGSNVDRSYKNTEYNDFAVINPHNVSSFNNTKQSKKVSSLGRTPHKKKSKIVKKVRIL
jgi:hypothetical protein